MTQNNINIAESYYTAMNDKDITTLAEYLHPNVKFLSPFAEIVGKEALLGAIKNFITSFDNLKIRTKCGAQNQVMLAYDVNFPEPTGKMRSAALLTFDNNLIIDIELFFDASVFKR